jgi:hypothetical protein
MHSRVGYKITAALLSLLVAAAPALGRITVRCEDGTPCPLPQRSVAPVALAAADHACCQAAAEPAECPQHLAPTPPKCVVQLTRVDLASGGQSTTAASLALLAILPESSLVPPHAPVRWPVIAAGDESPPCRLAPEQGHSPRAPPCA